MRAALPHMLSYTLSSFRLKQHTTHHLILILTQLLGGTGVADQIADLKRGAEIVVCTPGRMIDILCMQAGKLVNLRRVTMVVLDEADRCALPLLSCVCLAYCDVVCSAVM